MLALLLVLAPPQAAGSGSAARQEVVAVLERGQRDGLDAERLTQALARLLPARAPELFDVLAFGPAPERALAGAQEEALLATLARLGPLPLRPVLDQRLAASPPSEVRWASLLLLARVGTSLDLALLQRAVEGAGSGLEDELRSACAGVARNDPRILEPLRRWLLVAPAELAPEIARGIGDCGQPEALGVLAAALGYRAELDPEILAELGELAADAPKPIPEEILAELAAALDAEEGRTVRAAALAIGHAEDHGGLPQLVPLLEHEARGVRAAALWSLEHLSGLRYGTDPARWSAWLASEEAWGSAALERLREELRSPQPGVAIRALGELTSHGWRRHELASEATAALEHEDPAVRRLGCLALGRLGSTAVVAELEALQDDPDDSVVAAARRALGLLTGAPRPRASPRPRSSRGARRRPKRGER